MNEEFLDALACPGCQDQLTMREDKLHCNKCQKEYSFNQDIVALMPSQKISKQKDGFYEKDTCDPRT